MTRTASGALGLLIAGAALLPAPSAEPAADPKRLKPGVFLYAAPGLPDPNFAETVVLLVHHEQRGSMGLIVNRPTGILVRDAVTALGEMKGLELPLHWGGPVQPKAVLALVRTLRPPEGAVRVLPDVHFSAEAEHLETAARDPEAASRLRVYAGYSGWSAGQLAKELRQGSWIVSPADARSVFASDPSHLWLRVHELMKRLEVRLDATGARPDGGR